MSTSFGSIEETTEASILDKMIQRCAMHEPVTIRKLKLIET